MTPAGTRREGVCYQFQVDGRGFGSPIRDRWQDAAQDAVNAGYAIWSDDGVILDDCQGAEIARLPRPIEGDEHAKGE